MTVAENVCIGMGYPRRLGLIDWAAANATAERVMARVGCRIDPERRVFSLTRAEKSLLAIGRALEVQARLLVLDEPSASLPMSDVERLFDVLRGLRAQGMGIVYVSHRLDEVMAISDRAAVMRDGKLVAVQTTAQTNEAELVNLIVGKALAAAGDKAAVQTNGEPVLQLQAAASGNAGPLDLAVHRGEVLGLVGLRGAGHEAISKALFGREPLSAGCMLMQGRAVQLKTPADAIRGKAGVVIFNDSQYAIAVYKAKAMEAVIKKCGGCTVLSYEDSPISESSTRMPTLTASLLQKFGDKWTHSLAINDLYFDFMGRRSPPRARRATARRRPCRPATARRRPTSASAPSASRPAPCPSRSTCRAGRSSMR